MWQFEENREIGSEPMFSFTAAEHTAPQGARPTPTSPGTGTEGMSDDHRTMEIIQEYLKAHPEKILVEGDSCYPYKGERGVSPGTHGQSGTGSQSSGDINRLLKGDPWDRSHWTNPRARNNVVMAIIGENNLPKLLHEYNINGRAWTSDPSSYVLHRARIAESAIFLGHRVRDPWPEFNPYAPPEEGILGRIKFLEDEGYITRKSLLNTRNLQAVQALWSILVLVLTIWSLLQVLKWVWSCCLDDGEEWDSADREPHVRERRPKRARFSSGEERRLSPREESELGASTVPHNKSESGMPKAAFASSAFHQTNDTVHDSAAGVSQSDHRSYIPGRRGNNNGGGYNIYNDKYAYQQHQRSTGRYAIHARTESVAESGTHSWDPSYEIPHGNLRLTPRQPRPDQHNSRHGALQQQRKAENSNTILDDCFNTTDVEEDFTYEPSDQGYSHDEDYSGNHHINSRKEAFGVYSNGGTNPNERVASGDPIMQETRPQAPAPDTDRVQSSAKNRGRRVPVVVNGRLSSSGVHASNTRGGNGSSKRHKEVPKA